MGLLTGIPRAVQNDELDYLQLLSYLKHAYVVTSNVNHPRRLPTPRRLGCHAMRGE
jgi:hypothetical protein